MKSWMTTKFRVPKWSLYTLLGFFIALSSIPSYSTQQKVPVRTEQRDESRSVTRLVHFVKFHQPVSQNSFLFNKIFFASLLRYSNSIEVCFKNRDDLILLFAPFGINLIANFLPRSNEESFSSNLG